MLPLVQDIPSLNPPWTGIGKKIESGVRKALYDFKLIPENGKIGIALSGGKDSLTLLLMLKAISGKGFPPFDLTAFHVGGEFTCGAGVTLSFLKNICDALEIPVIVKESTKTLDNLECYSCSRERRSLIFQAAKDRGITTLAFGHTEDDQAQTVLMNLVQKGDFEGMCPKIHMVKYGIEIIRPLIYISEEKIRQFAKMQNFLRITCQCPRGQNSMRKKFDKMIDALGELVPEVRTNLARAALEFGSTKANRVLK